MARRSLSMRTVAPVAVLLGIFMGCGGGGGGGGGANGLLLYFGINGKGSCSSVIVNVDLGAAGAVLQHKAGGAPDCAIDSALGNKGCTATFTELNGGDDLRATIAGCTIPGVSNLFGCNFDDVDISAISSEASAQCTCATAGCDGTPPVCIDADPDPTSCEDCSNGQDDDGNGKTDCADPTCENSPSCDGSTTTTLNGSTSTTLSTEPITIDFTLASSAAAVGSLSFTANYTSAPGHFVGTGTAVSCTNKVGGASFSRNNRHKVRKLDLGWVSGAGFNATKFLASCVFIPDTPVPVPANFTIVINDALDTDGKPVRVSVDVDVNPAP